MIGSSVPILLTLVTVAIGLEPGDVDGSLGYGRTWRWETVQYAAHPEDIEDALECRHECKQRFSNMPVMASFSQVGSPYSVFRDSKYCQCFSRRFSRAFEVHRNSENASENIGGFIGSSYYSQPGTRAEGSFSGFCGNFSMEVDGGTGEGRTFENEKSVRMVTRTDSHVEDPDKCCQSCQANLNDIDLWHDKIMFSYDKRHQECACYESIPGKTPVTYVQQYFADICGSNVDPAFSTINTEGCYDMNIDYPGNDINLQSYDIWVRKSTAASCQYLCSKTNGCEYFTWTMGRKRCYLKTSKSTNSYEEGAVSGPKNCSG